tara:strand:+ start:3411 stop:3827 length:417 start_codon:yes stop_codon:yes gene_type:complete
MITCLFLCIGLAFANEDVVTVNKGEPAPFSGTLLSPSAAAKLLATGETDLAICQAEAEKEKAILTAEFNLAVSNKEAELAACTLRFTEYEKIYLNQIQYLEKRAVSPTWEKPLFFVGGVAVGIGVVALSAWTLDKIGN